MPFGEVTPQTRYARSGKVSIAYQTIGEAPVDVILAPGFPSHLEHGWRQPRLAHFYRRLASFCRLILFDKRGMGLSDRDRYATIGERMDDIRAVMDAAGSERAALLGVSEGGPLAILFAATYPERAVALMLAGAEVKEEVTDDWPWGEDTRAAFEESMASLAEGWGRSSSSAALYAPSLAHDQQFHTWWRRMLIQSATPSAAEAFMRMAFEIDVRHVLSLIDTPTLVVHRAGDRVCDVHNGRFLAEHIPGARYLELPGADHFPWAGSDDITEAVQAFLAEQVATGARMGTGHEGDGHRPVAGDQSRSPAPLTLEARARVLQAEGRLALQGGSYQAGRSMLARAADLYHDAGQALAEAGVRLELAHAAVAANDRVLADAEGRNALALFRRSGMSEQAEEAASLLRALDVPRSARQAAARSRLSRREAEVLRLVAAGRSNDEIAGDLVLSAHTVHRHVSNILTKLAVSSRAAAVAEAARSGML